MTDRYELASAIFGTKRAETDPSALSTAIITGTAVEDSESGMVRIIPDGNVIAPEGEDNSIVLPTSPNVKSGDNVIIISTGGTATTPIVAGASGSGDRLLAGIDGIETLIRETADGVLVAKVGQTVGALVNADGSFDVVSLTWDGSEPTVGASVYSGGEVTRIGREGETYLEVTYNSLKFIDKSGNTFFEVFDNRGQDGYSSQITEEHEVIHIMRGSGSYIFSGAGFETVYLPSDIVSIEIDGTVYGYDGKLGYAVCVLPSSQGGDALIGKTATIVYRTTQAVQAVTIGARGSGAVGNRSLAVGWANDATAPGSIAVGTTNTVTGYYGAAFGSHLISDSNNQTVLGTYNAPVSYAPLIVGNGFGESNRTNALVLDKDGNLEISGAFTGNPSYSFANDNLCSQSASDWEQGGISSTGANLNRTHTIRLSTASRMEVTGGTPYLIDIEDGYTVNMKPYTSAGTFYEDPNLAARYIQRYPFIWVPTQDGYLRMTCTIDGSTALAPSGIETALPVVRKASAADFAFVIYAMELNGYAY